MSDGDGFAEWAILELMGHRRLAGRVSEQEIAGQQFVRLDVYPDSAPLMSTLTVAPVVTQFYGPGAVYCITPTTEAIARHVGAKSLPEPVARWELPAPEPVRWMTGACSGGRHEFCEAEHPPCECDDTMHQPLNLGPRRREPDLGDDPDGDNETYPYP
jgi:hypothetical protein